MRTTIFCVAILFCVVPYTRAEAQAVEVNAGSTIQFSPGANQPCFDGVVIREGRALTSAEAGCTWENSGLRMSVFATSGPGVARVDASAEVKVVVAQFHVPTPENASATGYIPIHVTIPVTWDGRFFNMTVAPAATATVNMTARLRESNASDPNIAGQLISQNRFHGASHGGIFNCMSVPTDLISAATMLAGCAIAVTERETGGALVEISGVIHTNQVYNVELVMRADLFAPFVTDPYNAYVPERINFSEEPFGLFWQEAATLRIGTDPHQVVEELRDEIDELRSEVAQLRSDFENHYHTYLTGRGAGHNNTEAQTPPPLYPADDSQSVDTVGAVLSGDQPTSNPDSSPTSTSSSSDAAQSDMVANADSGGGSLALHSLFLLMMLALLRRRNRRGPTIC